METQKARWEDPFSPEGQREATAKILTGLNYRLFFEGITRQKLLETYQELTKIANENPDNDEMWKRNLRETIQSGKDKELRYWLIGLTAKTATNLNLKTTELPGFFDETMKELTNEYKEETRDTALLLWAGAATLTIRGSQKSKIGKLLEKSIAKSALLIIGLNEDKEDFRLNVKPDQEVSRETDVEVKTPRGWLRMEMALIGKGNSEVIGDKVGRMDRNGVILMDVLPNDSSAHNTAKLRGVKLIPMRNGHPVEELRCHLHDLKVSVQEESISSEEVETRVLSLPLEHFR